MERVNTQLPWPTSISSAWRRENQPATWDFSKFFSLGRRGWGNSHQFRNNNSLKEGIWGWTVFGSFKLSSGGLEKPFSGKSGLSGSLVDNTTLNSQWSMFFLWVERLLADLDNTTLAPRSLLGLAGPGDNKIEHKCLYVAQCQVYTIYGLLGLQT